MRRILFLVLSLIMVMVLITGCNNAKNSVVIKNTSDTIEDVISGDIQEKANDKNVVEVGTIIEETGNVVIDDLGREVTFPSNPERIIGLTSAVIESLYDLGFTPIAKVEEYKIRKMDTSIGNVQELNMEMIYSLEPDLIIASSRFHASLEEELIASGAVVYFFDPNAVGDIPLIYVRKSLGKLLDREEEGQAYINKILVKSEGLKKLTKEANIKTGVVMKMGKSVICAQSASSFGSMLKLLGIENIVPDNLPNSSKSSFVKYDAEKIVIDNPDVIILMASSKEKEANKEMLAKFMSSEKWKELDAVKNKMVFLAPFAANPNKSNPENMLKLYTDTLSLGK